MKKDSTFYLVLQVIILIILIQMLADVTTPHRAYYETESFTITLSEDYEDYKKDEEVNLKLITYNPNILELIEKGEVSEKPEQYFLLKTENGIIASIGEKEITSFNLSEELKDIPNRTLKTYVSKGQLILLTASTLVIVIAFLFMLILISDISKNLKKYTPKG